MVLMVLDFPPRLVKFSYDIITDKELQLNIIFPYKFVSDPVLLKNLKVIEQIKMLYKSENISNNKTWTDSRTIESIKTVCEE